MKKNSPAVLQAFIDIFFPRQCFGCETPLKFYEINLCLDCQIRVPLTSFHKTKKNLLFQKLELHFPIENATALFHFEKEGVLAHLIHLFKYQGIQKIGLFLGEWLAENLIESGSFQNLNGIVPVPLHPAKKRKRGFNQAELIANILAEKLKIPVYSHALKRIKNTTALAHLGEINRHKEVQNAFLRNPSFSSKPQHLLLIDDVFTTGATLAACAKALRKNSEIKLSIAVLACRL